MRPIRRDADGCKFFDASWKGPISVFLVARQDIVPGPGFHQTAIWTADAPAAHDRVARLQWGNCDECWCFWHFAKDVTHYQCGNPMDVNIYGLSYDGAVQRSYINCVEHDKIPLTGNPGFRGAFCLGNNAVYRSGWAQFGGYVAEVLVYNRGLSLAECQTVNRYLRIKYGQTGRQFVLEGHSQFTPLVLPLEKRLPGWDINNAAIGGTAMYVWVGQAKEKFAARSGRKSRTSSSWPEAITTSDAAKDRWRRPRRTTRPGR